MNELQTKLLGGYAAVRIASKEEFEKVIEFLAIKNCFMVANEPVSKMNYPGNYPFVLCRSDDGFIYWELMKDVDAKKYQLIDVKQLNLENNEDTVIEANATVISEVSEIDEKSMTLVINQKPEGSFIESNIDNLVALIPVIESKANVVVDADNYKSFVAKGTGVVPTLRKYAKNLAEDKREIKKRYEEPFKIFADKANMVIEALSVTAQKIDDNVKVFENERKEKLRKERQSVIDQLKEVMIKRNLISKEYADKFVFDEKWLNASCSKKKFQEEAEKQFYALIDQQEDEQVRPGMIENTIINTCLVAGVDEKMISREKYILQLKTGTNLGEITQSITDEVNNAKKREEAIRSQAEEELKQQKEIFERKQKEAELKHQQELEDAKKQAFMESSSENKAVYCDEKTGEVYAKSTDSSILVRIQDAPAKVPEDKIFSYTYTFSGNCKAILTFNKVLKALSKVFNTFKYQEVK